MGSSRPFRTAADYVIGIDPDAEQSGIALLVRQTGALTLQTLPFPELLDYIKLLSDRAKMIEKKSLCVVVEAGWMNDTANFHGYHHDNRGEKIARDVGRNNETGRKIAEMCRHWAIPTAEVPPLPLRIGKFNLWSGPRGKITHDEFCTLTGCRQGRTNQEERDAALLAWDAAGLPVRVIAAKRKKPQP